MPLIVRRLGFGLSSLVGCLVLTFALYHSVLTSWWCCDDPQILKHALSYSPWEYFSEPKAWRALVPYSLTPWLSLTYDLDHTLFGLNSVGYYAHNLLTISLCAWLICLIARRWVSNWYAFGGGLLFLLGAPVVVASHQLMVRHYLEGLLFFLLACWLLLRAFQEENSPSGWWAGIAFAVAVSAKEIYLPLGLVLFVLPINSLRQRLRVGWPLLLVMLLYVPWRWYMLGDPVGGYTPAAALGWSDLISALTQFGAIPGLLLSQPWPPLAGLLLCAVLLTQRIRCAWLPLVFLTLLVLLLAPLIPLARQPGIGAGSERYFIALWAALALGATLLAGATAAGRGLHMHFFSCLVLVLLGGFAWQQSDQVRAALLPSLQEQSMQGKALISAGERDIIYLTPGVASWYVSGIIDLQQELGRSLPSPRAVSDEIDLVSQPLVGQRILRYDQANGRMADITQQIPRLVSDWQQRIQPRPLSIMMEFDSIAKNLRWQLGPYQHGSYTLLSGMGSHRLPTQGTLRMEKLPEQTFRFRYDDPEGWSAYTPALRFVTSPQRTHRLTMQGPGIASDEIHGGAR